MANESPEELAKLRAFSRQYIEKRRELLETAAKALAGIVSDGSNHPDFRDGAVDTALDYASRLIAAVDRKMDGEE